MFFSIDVMAELAIYPCSSSITSVWSVDQVNAIRDHLGFEDPLVVLVVSLFAGVFLNLTRFPYCY